MLIRRGDKFLIPQGATQLLTGDHLMIMGADKVLEQAVLLLQEKD